MHFYLDVFFLCFGHHHSVGRHLNCVALCKNALLSLHSHTHTHTVWKCSWNRPLYANEEGKMQMHNRKTTLPSNVRLSQLHNVLLLYSKQAKKPKMPCKRSKWFLSNLSFLWPTFFPCLARLQLYFLPYLEYNKLWMERSKKKPTRAKKSCA